MINIRPSVVYWIARLLHEANRAYCAVIGDHSQRSWAESPQWQKDSAIKGVWAIVEGRVTRPEQSHESWLEEKRLAGWTYGPVKDEATKQHPCFVPYDELPAEQRVKDYIFFSVVKGALATL